MKGLNKNIEQEIDQILQSGSNKERVNTSPFFTTRVIGKVEQLEESVVWFPKLSVVLKPVLALLIIVNVVNFYIYNDEFNSETTQSENVELAASDYTIWNNDFILSDETISNN